MWYTLFNDLIASVQRDSSTSANIISGLFSRHSNAILEKAKGHGVKQDVPLPKPKQSAQQGQYAAKRSSWIKSSNICWVSNRRTPLLRGVDANLKRVEWSNNRITTGESNGHTEQERVLLLQLYGPPCILQEEVSTKIMKTFPPFCGHKHAGMCSYFRLHQIFTDCQFFSSVLTKKQIFLSALCLDGLNRHKLTNNS